ncbi:DUF6612 family protein [Sporosarcina sp. YIM B06819]|uniref:DUF6612 family protein n=1 Tax=Sporosarcina sp. YIM B06819 TaxID=3081769 RepID=UPI00298CFC85|nr:DUF6612 family protein [Sporosarcina sp. YIM B06819]
MKNVWKIAVVGLLAVVLSACGNAAAQGNLTAQEVFEKAKDASTKLESVHSTISFEDFWRTTVPEDKKTMKYDFQSDATLHPVTFKQRLIIKPSLEKAWGASVYKTNDRIFIEEDSKKELDELPSGALSELFGAMMDHVNPTVNLSFFEPFADDFELEPIDYGYNLRLSMSREQYQEFQKLVFGVDDISGEYAFINKFDIVIGIDINTFYTTDFKMTLDTTTYSTTEVNGNSHRVKQTISAVYSKYDHVEPIKLPAKVLDVAAQ